MKTHLATLLIALSLMLLGHSQAKDSDCSTLKYQKHSSAWLCGEASVCAGDICKNPSDFGFDYQFKVYLRDKGGKSLESKTLSYGERKFCFEGRESGEYQLAFVLYQNGVPQPARVFPLKYKREPMKPNDRIYMIEASCPGS